jgi:hypothetical protein
MIIVWKLQRNMANRLEFCSVANIEQLHLSQPKSPREFAIEAHGRSRIRFLHARPIVTKIVVDSIQYRLVLVDNSSRLGSVSSSHPCQVRYILALAVRNHQLVAVVHKLDSDRNSTPYHFAREQPCCSVFGPMLLLAREHWLAFLEPDMAGLFGHVGQT